MSTPGLYELVSKETFKEWIRIQYDEEKSINMHEASLRYPELSSPKVFSAILEHYDELKKRYVDTPKPMTTSEDMLEHTTLELGKKLYTEFKLSGSGRSVSKPVPPVENVDGCLIEVD